MGAAVPHRVDELARSLRELGASGRYRELLALWRRSGSDAIGYPDLLLLVAAAATRTGAFELAATLAADSLERFRIRGDADGRMRALNLLGAQGFERGRLDDAERCFDEALRLARELDDPALAARASNNLASVAHLRGRPDLALGLYRGALLAFQRLGDRRGVAETWHNLGLAFRQLAEWREAQHAAGEAVRHAELVGDRALMALATAGRAEVELERGKLELAQQMIERASRLAAEGGDELGAAEVGRLRALLLLSLGEPHAAYVEAELARVTAVRLESVLLAAECAAVMACALRRLGRDEEAGRRRAEAVTAFAQLGATTLLERFERDWECAIA